MNEVTHPLIRPIHDDPPNESAEILAAQSRLVPMGSGDSGTADRSHKKAVDWQTAMKRAIRSTAELRRVLDLPSELPQSYPGEPDFPTFAPLEFVSRIERGNPDDPLLRQVLASNAEQADAANFVADPVGDLDALAAPGLIHKYQGRTLVVTSGVCGVHCRYCFRREFPYSESGSTAQSWQPALEYIEQHREVDEVILSGGDPLTVVDAKLFDLLDQLEGNNHLRRLRIHTRMPVVIPQRVTNELVERLKQSRFAVWIVIHANHANELDEHVIRHVERFINAGIPVLNQSVLLRGVNDDADALIQLSRDLVNHRIQPYYLHQLDRVRGAAHFEVPMEQGMKLIEEMRKQLPGYAVPTYVREDAGEPSKTTIAIDP